MAVKGERLRKPEKRQIRTKAKPNAEERELCLLKSFDNPGMLKSMVSIREMVLDFVTSGSTPLVRSTAILMLARTKLASLVDVFEEVRRKDPNQYVRFVAGNAIRIVENGKKG